MGIESAGGIFARSKLIFQHYFFEHFSTGATKRELRTENWEPRTEEFQKFFGPVAFSVRTVRARVCRRTKRKMEMPHFSEAVRADIAVL